MPPPHPTFQEPVIQVDDEALDSWKQDQLTDADALLTAAIYEPRNPSPHVLASRALVRVRLKQWDAALVDAETVLVTFFLYSLRITNANVVIIRPSKFSRPSLATSRRVSRLSAKAKGTRATGHATSHSSASIRLTLAFSF